MQASHSNGPSMAIRIAEQVGCCGMPSSEKKERSKDCVMLAKGLWDRALEVQQGRERGGGAGLPGGCTGMVGHSKRFLSSDEASVGHSMEPASAKGHARQTSLLSVPASQVMPLQSTYPPVYVGLRHCSL